MAVTHLQSLYQHNRRPSVIGTDCELALMNAIDRHFLQSETSRFICFWHICKNLMVNCKARFETEERWKEFERFFSDVVHSMTPEEYLDRVEKFKAEFNYNEGELHELPPANSPVDLARHTTKTLEQDAVRYVLRQWLEPRHMNIVHAWTNRFFNQNTMTTSRLEGAHAMLKRWIGTPNKKLSSVWASIQLALSDQINEIRIKRSRPRDSLTAGVSEEFYYGVLGRISHFALHEICKQVKYAWNEELRSWDGQSSICTGKFIKSMGMPCWHIIQERMSQNRGISTFGP